MSVPRREPSYDEALKTIQRSIQARGGMGERSRVLEALVWNFYKHLPREEKRKIDSHVNVPGQWDASGWINFKRTAVNNPAFSDLVGHAEEWIDTAIDNCEISVTYLFNAQNKRTEMLVMYGTKIQLGAG